MPRKYTRKIKRRRIKRGGDEVDIEMGPDSDVTPMKTLPPDPERFRDFEENALTESFTPVSDAKVSEVFNSPNPEEKITQEQEMMSYEDPLNKEPFQREELNIFNTGGRRRRRTKRNRKTRRNKKRSSRRRRR